MTSLIALATVALSGAQGANINDYVQPDLKDATMVAEIVKGDQKELKKINKDFGESYRFTSSTFYLKEPLMMRVEAHVDDTNVVYIVNGPIQRIKAGGISARQDLSRAPGRRQTLMDIGVLTPALMESLLDAKFVRMDRETGNAVFDLTYKEGMNDSSRYRVWIDKTKKYVTKREWYNQWTRQLATFYYLNPKQINGVWFPTRLEVRNVDNVVAGVTKYDSIKVNTGLSDSLFSTK